MKVRPLQDRVLIELEPEKGTTLGGIVRVGHDPVRTGHVRAVGPGKLYRDRFVPTELSPGDRVCFFQANIETQAEAQLHFRMPDGHVLLPETAVLGVLHGDIEVSA